MFCEHPTCSLETNTRCKSHCDLFLCQKHRVEHENDLLYEVEKQLGSLSKPLSILYNKSESDLKKSEESHQQELNRINCLFDSYSSSINQRLNLINTINKSIKNERDKILLCKSGDRQLTKEDYQQIKNLLDQIETNLHEQTQMNDQIRSKKFNMNSCPIVTDNQKSIKVECIEILDSDDEPLVQYPTNTQNQDQWETISNASASNNDVNQNVSNEVTQKQKTDTWSYRDFCPLTEAGVFGLDPLFKLPRLCSTKYKKQRYLYVHFTKTHRIESSIAYELVKAVQNKCDPMKTKIFPEDNTEAFVEDINCPFNNEAIEFTRNNSIPNTPCYASISLYHFREHLRAAHCITKTNAKLIYDAMKNYSDIKQVQFQDNLCEI